MTISSYCTYGNCVDVEFAQFHDVTSVYVRDTKDPTSELVFTLDEWRAFLAGVKAGEFDHREAGS